MMNNPFDLLEARLSNIERLLLDLKHAPKPVEELPDRIIIDEVCNITGLRKPTIYKMTSTGEIPCFRIGQGRLVFSRSELKKLMEARTIRKQSLEQIATNQLQTAAIQKAKRKG